MKSENFGQFEQEEVFVAGDPLENGPLCEWYPIRDKKSRLKGASKHRRARSIFIHFLNLRYIYRRKTVLAEVECKSSIVAHSEAPCIRR